MQGKQFWIEFKKTSYRISIILLKNVEKEYIFRYLPCK